MNQIAIGDASAYIVLEGQSVAAPYRRAAAFFAFSPDPFVKEKIEIQMSGTPAQISSGLAALEKVSLRAKAFILGEYASPQYLRFQQTAGGSYFYTPIQDLYFEANPNGYITHQRGSLILILHYTRPNYFDGPETELALSGRGGTDVTGGFEIFNHTDFHATHGNTALVKAAGALTDLPAALRIELENTYATDEIKDLFIGVYHHPTSVSEDPFFAFAADLSGGTQYSNAAAINETYRTVTWTASVWTSLLNHSISLANTALLDGRTYRPILHLYSSHAYTDLSLKITLKRGTYVLQSCDPVYADPDFDYIVFPPIQIPPNQLLRENSPHHVEVLISGLKEDGTAASLSVDQLMFFPLDYGAFFKGFYPTNEDDVFIDDNFKGLFNVQYATGFVETIAHVRQGGPLLLYPSENSRLFFMLVTEDNTVDILRTATITAYYRQRLRMI